MKNILLAGILLLFLTAQAFAAATVEHHDLQLELLPEQHILQGTDRLTVRPEGATRLLLTMSPTAQMLDVTADGRKIPWSFELGNLGIDLPSGNTVPVEIHYWVTFADQAPVQPLNTEDPSFGVTATIGPEGVFLGGGAGWYPEDAASRATFRLQIKTPAGMRAVTSGRLVSAGSGESVWQIEHPVQGLALVAGAYEVQTAPAGGIPVYTFFFPQSRQFAPSYLQAAVGYLDLYTKLFGPYPFEKFAVVENFFPTGYGYPSWTLLGSSVVALPFIVETSLGHEIAHSWWGNGVWVNTTRGNWSEGLTTYVADHLYKERQSPEEGREYRLKILRDYSTLVTKANDFPLSKFGSRTTAAQQAVGYGKAAMVFHMARRQVGDEAFWAGLRQVAQEKLFAPASWGNFAAAIGKAGGKDLTPFFRQWVQRPGAPRLLLRDIKEEKTPAGWTITGLLRQYGDFYTLQVPLLLETEAGPVETFITARGATTPFRLEATGRPQRLIVDPQVDIFRRLDATEIPPTVNAVRGSTKLLAIAAADLPPETLAAGRLLLPALGQESVEILPEKNVSVAEIQGRDILFLGLPTRKQLRPQLPAALSLGAGEFTLEGKKYSGPDTVLFAALPRPAEAQRVSALFLPGSPTAATAAARKIPHYGKYSYLVFVNGTNEVKDIWPVLQSPMVHVFQPVNR